MEKTRAGSLKNVEWHRYSKYAIPKGHDMVEAFLDGMDTKNYHERETNYTIKLIGEEYEQDF